MAKVAKKILKKIESLKTNYGNDLFKTVPGNSSAGSNNTGLSNIKSNKDLLTRLKKLRTELAEEKGEKQPYSLFSWQDLNAKG